MSLFNPEWTYVSAEESRKPNYLRNKFNRIKKQQRDEAEAQKAEALKVVQPIRKKS